MASAKALARVEALVWVLVYGGLLILVLGLFTGRSSPALGWTLGLAGLAVAVAGVVLVWVRSRMQESETQQERPK